MKFNLLVLAEIGFLQLVVAEPQLEKLFHKGDTTPANLFKRQAGQCPTPGDLPCNDIYKSCAPPDGLCCPLGYYADPGEYCCSASSGGGSCPNGKVCTGCQAASGYPPGGGSGTGSGSGSGSSAGAGTKTSSLLSSFLSTPLPITSSSSGAGAGVSTSAAVFTSVATTSKTSTPNSFATRTTTTVAAASSAAAGRFSLGNNQIVSGAGLAIVNVFLSWVA